MDRLSFIDHYVKKAIDYRKEILLVTALVVTISAGVGGYFWYRGHVARLAHRAYAEAAELLSAKVLKYDDSEKTPGRYFASEEEKLEAIAHEFGMVYEQYPHVGIGVMAGAARAQALLRLGHHEKAASLLADVLARITAPELRALYTVQYALTLLDGDEVANTKGISLLQQLGASRESVVQDAALYHLGEYYWATGDFAQAKNYWQQLTLLFEHEEKHISPFVEPAREKIALLQAAE